MWQTLGLLLLGIFAAESVKIDVSNQNVVEGRTLTLNCTAQRQQSNLKWKKNTVPLSSGGNIQIKASVADNGENVSFLTITNVISADAGKYYCVDDVSSNEASVDIKVYKVDTKDALFQYQQGATISCIVPNPASTVEVSWKKNGTDVKAGEKFTVHSNGSLEFREIVTTREDAGVYECLIKVGSDTFSDHVTLWAEPFVIPFEKSKNLVQEERLDVRCRVLGYPAPSITWYKDGTLIQVNAGDSRYKLEAQDGFANAKLKVESVGFDDAGEYKCVATATHTSFTPNNTATSNQIILVRVKDKLAALWPFLGIVAEVVLLCVIIFIFEKKRNKDAAEEDECNQDGGSPEKNKEGVRHRGNTNNPRA